MLRAVVVMDYQNVHLTAHDVFNRHGHKHDSLVHPRWFADVTLRRRNQLQRDGYPQAVLAEVIAFRGLPNTLYDSDQNRRCLAQAERWRLEGAVVELRDLKYSFQLQSDGRLALDSRGIKIPRGLVVRKV